MCFPPQEGREDWLTKIEAGQLGDSISLGRTERMGFTPDSSGLIVKRQDDTWWVISLDDFSETPFLPGVLHPPLALCLWCAVWSPDHTLVAMIDRIGGILVFSPRDQAIHKVAQCREANFSQLGWSPNSREIVYTDGIHRSGTEEIVAARVVNVQSQESRTLIEDKVYMSGASWSPTGEWIAVRAWPEDGGTTLWLIDPRGDSRIRHEYDWESTDITDSWQNITWSPDGSRLALKGHDPEGFGALIVEVPSGEVIARLTDNWKPLGWDTDGTMLLVRDPDSRRSIENLRWVPIKP